MTFRTISGHLIDPPIYVFGADGEPRQLEEVKTYKNWVKNPSGKESTGVYQEVRRNYCYNPQPVSVAGWSAAGATVVTAPWDSSRKAMRGTATGTSTFYLFSAPSNVSTPNGTYVTVSATIQVPAGKWYKTFVHNRTGNVYMPALVNVPYVQSTGAPTRVSATYKLTADQPDVDMALLVYENNAGTVLAAGTECFMGDVLIERTQGVVLPYFDGATAPGDELEYAWSGTANNSAAIARGIGSWGFSGGAGSTLYSTDWSADGDGKSLRVVAQYPTNGSGYVEIANNAANGSWFSKGKTFTLMATCRLREDRKYDQPYGRPSLHFSCTGTAATTANQYVYTPSGAAGVYELRMTFTIPDLADNTAWRCRLYNGGRKGDTDAWFDKIMLVEGDYAGDYFDGDTTLDNDHVSVWLGTPNRSESEARP